MKAIVLLIRSFYISLLFILPGSYAFSQINVVSSNGYNVVILIKPVSIIPSPINCPNGFNYNVTLDYTITFNGSNIPASLYTLQGTLGCTDGSNFFDLPNTGGSGTVNSGSNVWVGTSTCNIATVNSLGCNLLTIEIEGPGISARFISLPVQGALAVKLENFLAEAKPGKVRLAWTTVSEENNNFFTVERSADGNQWTEVKKVNGAGNSTIARHYECFDETPLTGTSYYRLRQTDFDGKTTLSSVKAVKFSALNGIAVYPVPNAGNTINLKGLSNYANHELQLVNINGKVLFNAMLSGTSAELPSLSSGMYFIRVTDKVSGETASFRYIKI